MNWAAARKQQIADYVRDSAPPRPADFADMRAQVEKWKSERAARDLAEKEAALQALEDQMRAREAAAKAERDYERRHRAALVGHAGRKLRALGVRDHKAVIAVLEDLGWEINW